MLGDMSRRYLYLRYILFLNMVLAIQQVAAQTHQKEILQPKNYSSQKQSKCIKIALEGMPGAGKTSTLFRLISDLNNVCVVLSELNPTPSILSWKKLSTKDQGQKFHHWWASRMKIMQRLSPHVKCFLLDRTYFTNLAYAYAFDKFLDKRRYGAEVQDKKRYIKEASDGKRYKEHKALFEKDFKNEYFDLLIILDVSPKNGLIRRNKINDKIPWPWFEEIFLSFLREFYHLELPKFFNGEILYIDTDQLSLNETIQRINDKLKSILKVQINKKQINKYDLNAEKIINKFAEDNNLGIFKSAMVNVFEYPTIYFRKHSVQLVDGKPIFFNNNRLEFIADNLNNRN